MRVIACLALAAGLIPAAEPLSQVFQKAVAALSAGDYAAAESGFRQVLTASPEHVCALPNLGTVYSGTARISEPIAMYRRALDVRPGDKSLLLNLGIVKSERFRTG